MIADTVHLEPDEIAPVIGPDRVRLVSSKRPDGQEPPTVRAVHQMGVALKLAVQGGSPLAQRIQEDLHRLLRLDVAAFRFEEGS